MFNSTCLISSSLFDMFSSNPSSNYPHFARLTTSNKSLDMLTLQLCQANFCCDVKSTRPISSRHVQQYAFMKNDFIPIFNIWYYYDYNLNNCNLCYHCQLGAISTCANKVSLVHSVFWCNQDQYGAVTKDQFGTYKFHLK